MSREFRTFREFREIAGLPKIPAKIVKGVILGVIAIAVLWGSFYQVGPEEMGVILRFGRFVRTTEPGLHMKAPLGIERLMRVPVQRQLKVEFGFRTSRPGINTQYASNDETKAESVMLTGDLNVVDVEWIVQYKIR
ncbi:MAG: SPFH domain-containing protein, partial [Acidobacteriota bacterium]